MQEEFEREKKILEDKITLATEQIEQIVAQLLIDDRTLIAHGPLRVVRVRLKLRLRGRGWRTETRDEARRDDSLLLKLQQRLLREALKLGRQAWDEGRSARRRRDRLRSLLQPEDRDRRLVELVERRFSGGAARGCSGGQGKQYDGASGRGVRAS